MPLILPPIRKHMAPLLVGALLVSAVAALGGISFVTISQSTPVPLTVTGVTPNNSSVRIFYNPVSGAKDYRVYDVASPSDVKYAGLAHYTDAAGNPIIPPGWVANTGADVPAFDIEWNGLNDTAPHTLIVEAVDALGPVPHANLYSTVPQGPHVPLASGGMLGSNKGTTQDGKTSTNGQGPYTNNPNVIARSQPFIVQAQPSITPLGKVAGASQSFLDTFDQPEAASLKHTVANKCGTDAVGDVGVDTYTLNAGTPKESTIEMRLHDGDNSMPFISNSHFMDMLFSGGTSSCPGGTDITYASLAVTPKQTVNMGSGAILHQTMEVDAHTDFNRWMAFDLSPAADPIQTWEPDLHQVNNHNQALYVDLLGERLDVRIFNGGGSGVVAPVFSTSPAVLSDLYVPNDFMQSGRGFDDRSKLDLFVSQTHLALFEDNKLLTQLDIPAGSMPWFNGAVKTYFTHYMYHSDNNVAFLRNEDFVGLHFCYPMNAYEFNDPVNGLSTSQNACGIAYPPGYGFPYSDERHWDNLGFEVLPAGSAPASDFSPLGASAALGQPQPPQFTGGPTPVPTNTPTANPTSTATLVSTNTAVPTNTPVSATNTAVVPPTSTSIPATNTAVPPTATSIPATQTPSVAPCRAKVSINGGPDQYINQPNSFCGLP